MVARTTLLGAKGQIGLMKQAARLDSKKLVFVACFGFYCRCRSRRPAAAAVSTASTVDDIECALCERQFAAVQ